MKFTKMFAAAATLTLSLSSGAAFADTAATCSKTQVTIGSHTAQDCAGFYSGNLNADGTTGKGVISWTDVNNLHLFTNAGNLLAGPLDDSYKVEVNSKGTTITFNHTMIGETIIGIHSGGVDVVDGTKKGSGTAFYLFDAGTTGITSVSFNNIKGISNATLLGTNLPASAVPEAETYAMMLAGIGMLGLVARRRKQG